MSDEAKTETAQQADHQYGAPHLSDFGPISELTKAISGDTGDDGAYPSYTASNFV